MGPARSPRARRRPPRSRLGKPGRHERLHRRNHLLFDRFRQRSGQAVADHRAVGLVAPFGEHPPADDVARHPVRVGRDPQPPPVELPLQAQGEIRDDFAGQEDHGQVVAKGPHGDQVINVRRESAAIHLGEHLGRMTGQTPGRGAGLGLLPLRQASLKFLARRQLAKGDLDRRQPGGQVGACRLELAFEQPAHLVGHGPAVKLGHLHLAPRLRVGVGPAADRDQGGRAGVLGLDQALGHAGPVPVKLIVHPGERGAVAGIIHQDRGQLALLVFHAQQRQAMIHVPLRVDADPQAAAILDRAPVHGEFHGALSPAQSGRSPGGQGGQGDLFHFVDQLGRIALDVPRVLLGQWLQRRQRQESAQPGPRMDVRRANDEALALQAGLGRKPRGHLVGHLGRHPAVLNHHEHGRAFARVGADGQGLGPDPLGNALRLLGAAAIAGQPDRIVGRDVDSGHADGNRLAQDRPRLGQGTRRNKGRSGKDSADAAHAIAPCRKGRGEPRFNFRVTVGGTGGKILPLIPNPYPPIPSLPIRRQAESGLARLLWPW